MKHAAPPEGFAFLIATISDAAECVPAGAPLLLSNSMAAISREKLGGISGCAVDATDCNLGIDAFPYEPPVMAVGALERRGELSAWAARIGLGRRPPPAGLASLRLRRRPVGASRGGTDAPAE